MIGHTAEAQIIRHPLADRAERLAHIREVSRWMDEAVLLPGTRFRIGLDGILGLIPGFGDVIGLVVSSYIVLVAAQLNVPNVILVRMAINVLIDSLIGSIPVLGDLFDFAFKANRLNIALIESHLVSPRRAHHRSAWFIAALALIALGFVVLLTLLIGFVVTWAWALLASAGL